MTTTVPVTVPATPDALAPLELTRELMNRLEEARVGYCHWKSTTSIAVAMAGRTDLDILVLDEDAARFDAAVATLGFKAFRSHESRQFPGVRDFLGHDAESGRLVHLHVYQRLILGERYVKNHHLPIERAMVQGSELRDGVRVPSPEVEALVLSIRTLLKYRDVDALRDLTGLGRRGGIEPGSLRELLDLGARVDPEALRAAIEEHVPDLPPALVFDLLELARSDPRNARRLIGMRRSLRRAMRRYQRRSAAAAWLTYAQARLIRTWPISLVARPLSRRAGRRKSPAKGGLSLAVVGPDGAGKSTVIAALDEWLAWRVNTTHVYLGSAQPSPQTRALKLAAKALRTMGARRAGSVLMALRHVGDARDRRTRAEHARRLASRGYVVLMDRFPLPGVLEDGRTIDGPRIRAQLGTKGWALRRLAALEESIYRDIPGPHHVVVLRLAPEVALARKASRDPASISSKARALSEMSWDGIDMTEIDAEQPLPDVLRQVRTAVWGLL